MDARPDLFYLIGTASDRHYQELIAKDRFKEKRSQDRPHRIRDGPFTAHARVLGSESEYIHTELAKMNQLIDSSVGSSAFHQLIFDSHQGRYLAVGDEQTAHDLLRRFDELLLTDDQPEIILPSAIVQKGGDVDDGVLVKALATPWLAIAKELERNPKFLNRFVNHPRAFEEFLAATYDRSGCPEVTLTPQSGDRGRDVIATWPGKGHIRIYDQAKAYSPNHRVTADDVRAMFGVINLGMNVSKGVITTTSKFAPGVLEEFRQVMPYRLELTDGDQLLEWIRAIAGKETA